MEGLHSIDLDNIANLTLNPQSFELSPMTSKTRITIRNTTLDILPSSLFRGNVDAISFESVRIGQMRAFAFANINKTERITLENCQIATMEAQAFKKFDVSFLHIVGGDLGDQVPSKTMNDVEVYETFKLDGVRMGTVHPSAFIMKRPKTVAIQNCDIEALDGEAFDINARGAVIVKNNTLGSLRLGAFLGIRADGKPPSKIPYDLFFSDNSVRDIEEGSLMFNRSSFRVQLNNILVSKPCDCLDIPTWRNNILNFSNVYARVYSAQSGLTFSSLMTAQDAEDPETFLCLDEDNDLAPANFLDFEAKSCALGKSMLILGLALGGLLLVILVGVVAVVVFCRRRRRTPQRKKWISVPTSAPDVVAKKNGVIGRDASASGGGPVDSRITMVVPDGRLYRETEFHVIVEKAEPLTTEL